jgi:cytochrome c peroxidase
MATATRQFARVAMRTTARSTFVSAPRQVSRQQGRRFYSSEPAKSSGTNWFLLAGVAAAAGAGAVYYLQQQGAATPKVFKPTKEDYQAVYNEIAGRLEEKDDYDDGSYGPVLLRLAWHASGTYDKVTGTGGSNGATMRFAPESEHGANAGLNAARDFLKPVKGK